MSTSRNQALLIALSLGLLPACGQPGTGSALDTSPAAATGSYATLAAAAEANYRHFGVGIWPGKLSDSVYSAIVAREFDLVTPTEVLGMNATEPSPNQFNFTSSEPICSWATKNGKKIHGGPLLYWSSPPSWTGTLSGTALRSAMLNHVTGVMKHYQGKIAYWDVVQEAYLDNGTLRSSPFGSMGTDWIEAAFRTARAADPTAKLCYKDYFIDSFKTHSAKTEAVFAKLRQLKTEAYPEVPIDCVAIEGYFTSGNKVPDDFATTLQSFAQLGLEVLIVDLDVTSASPTEYAKVVQACLATPGCSGITVEAVRDSDSWQSSESPVLFDSQGQAKAAYTAVIDAFSVPLYQLEVSKAGIGNGWITSSPAGIDCGSTCTASYTSGTRVTLSPAPANDGSVFAGWRGPCTGTGACTLTMNESHAVTATFDNPRLGPDTTPPSAPTEFAWSKQEGTVTLSWGGSTDDRGPVEYDLYYGSYLLFSTIDTSMAFIGFKGNVPYQFNLRARDPAGNVSETTTITVLIAFGVDTTPPTAPTNLRVSNVTASSVTLSWTASSDDVGVVLYEIFVDGVRAAVVPNATAATVRDITPSSSHTFTVRALDAASNESPSSEGVTVTTTAK
jgi:endo-1,4-beta-xylanase